MSVQSIGVSNGGMEKDFCPNLIQPFLENIDRKDRNDGGQKLYPVFRNLHRKGQSYHGSDCRYVLIGRFQCEEEEKSSDPRPIGP